jgi:hypothetical protein
MDSRDAAAISWTKFGFSSEIKRTASPGMLMLDDRKWEGSVMVKIIQKNGWKEKQNAAKNVVVYATRRKEEYR